MTRVDRFLLSRKTETIHEATRTNTNQPATSSTIQYREQSDRMPHSTDYSQNHSTKLSVASGRFSRYCTGRAFAFCAKHNESILLCVCLILPPALLVVTTQSLLHSLSCMCLETAFIESGNYWPAPFNLYLITAKQICMCNSYRRF